MLDGKLALLLLDNAADERQARSLLAVCYLWRDHHLTPEVLLEMGVRKMAKAGG